MLWLEYDNIMYVHAYETRVIGLPCAVGEERRLLSLLSAEASVGMVDTARSTTP